MPHVKIDDDMDAYIRAQQRRVRRWSVFAAIAKITGALAVIGGLLFVQCNGCEVSDDDTLAVIRSQGLRDPDLRGASPGACAEHESSRRFIATNAQNQRVSGTVCCGAVVKGCTIRW